MGDFVMSNSRDRQILNSIVNPLLPIGEAVFDPEEEGKERDPEDAVETEAPKLSKSLERQAIAACERGDVESALETFRRAIEADVGRASCYNNRAQAFRLKGDIASALNDIESALTKSGGRGRAAKQAFVQRGLIHRRNGNDEQAKKDFEKASDLGSEFAKVVLVEMNPFAALCNKMLKTSTPIFFRKIIEDTEK